MAKTKTTSNSPRGKASEKTALPKGSKLGRAILGAMHREVRTATAEQQAKGVPVAIWRDGKVVRLMPDGSVKPMPTRRKSRRRA